MFYGLFIGIDRYASPGINHLNCARRDAIALRSLFADNLGGAPTLLTDENATKTAIEEELRRLSSCDEDDVVVVSFSGHGTSTHEIVPYDADRRDLTASCISLDEVAGLCARIPAKRFICVLDCCFSGGMGAKALEVEVLSRDIDSVEDKLKAISGEGRIVLTASRAKERAWECQAYGHGYLTFHLIEALRGAAEVTAGKIGVFRLFEYVVGRVSDDAGKRGKQQHPTVLGSIDGNMAWPVFTAGPLYDASFPARASLRIEADVKNLAKLGFPEPLIETWAGPIKSLNSLQVDAINDFGLLNGDHLVVSAPTSSGKTLIGELAALRGVLDRKRSLFLFPLKALVNDKLQHFNSMYGPFGVRTIKATGESSSDDLLPLMRGQYDVCLMTYEKFSALVMGSPYLLDQVGTIVIDEVQMIADESRGVNLEFILTLLKMRRKEGTAPQLIALSAVIGDTNGLEGWLRARLLRHDERPIPLDEGILMAHGALRFIESDTGEEKTVTSYVRPEPRKGTSQDTIIPLVRKLVGEGKSVIVFRETKGEARGCAKYLAESLGLRPAQDILSRLPNGDPSVSSRELRRVLQGGVAFHISDLDAEERALVEEHFRSPSAALKVIAATTTLAMGVNTPASAVIIAGLDHPGGKPYTVAEYKNIIGRAGRLGFAERGSSYLIASSGADGASLWTKYVRGVPEDLHSHFLERDTDPRSLIVRILVGAGQRAQGLSEEHIISFLEDSFGAYQRKANDPGWSWSGGALRASLGELRTHKLVELDASNTYHLTPIGRVAGESGIEVRSVLRIAAALRGLTASQINDPTLIALVQLTAELDDVYFPINKKSTQKEPQTWRREVLNQGVPPQVVESFHRAISEEIQSTLRAKRAVACLLWVAGKPINEIETLLTQFGGAFDGAAGPIRSVTSRLCDTLPTVARIAELMNTGLDLGGSRMTRLLVRLDIGIPASVADLGSRIGKVLTRGDYLKLATAGIGTPEQFKEATQNLLLQCLDGSETRLAQARAALAKSIDYEAAGGPSVPILPAYES
jgi:helicase